MNTREFIKRLRRYAKDNNLEFDEKCYESKGSHRSVQVGNSRTTVPFKKDLSIGTRREILKQLNMNPSEFLNKK